MSTDKKPTDESASFKVTDKRHFTAEGEKVEPGGATADEAVENAADQGGHAPEAAAPPPPPEKEPGPAGEPAGSGGAPETVDFTHLIMSLAGTAYHSLGVPDPVTREKGIVNLPAASQMIDLLSILEEKTRGNLTPQEEQILSNILAELKHLYFQTSGFGG